MTATADITKKVTDLQELKRLRDELEEEIEALSDSIKAYMGSETEMMAGAFKVFYKTVVSNRFDTKTFKAENPNIAAMYTHPTETRPLKVV